MILIKVGFHWDISLSTSIRHAKASENTGNIRTYALAEAQADTRRTNMFSLAYVCVYGHACASAHAYVLILMLPVFSLAHACLKLMS